MTVAENTLPFGLREVWVTPINNDGTFGAAVQLPAAQKLTFSETEDYVELRGDDRSQTKRGKGPVGTFSFSKGGISIDAWKVITGGSVSTSGISPNATKRFNKKTTDVRPHFKAEGRSISESGGDVHLVYWDCLADGNIQGSMEEGAFWITELSGTAFGSKHVGDEDSLYDLVENETATPISGDINELQLLVIDATGGTYTLTFNGVGPTAAIAWNASPAAITVALEALANIVPGDVSIDGAVGGPYTIEFTGALAGANVAQLVPDSTNLTGATHTAS
jgi:hypothetical protein